MRTDTGNDRKMTIIFERYLTVWVGLCIMGGILKACLKIRGLGPFSCESSRFIYF